MKDTSSIPQKAKNALIPAQKNGAHTGVTKKIRFRLRQEALNAFEEARRRLLDINKWQVISGGGAEFQHTNSKGKELYNSFPEVGDLIRIKLPAPGNEAGDGYDWVRIEKFESAKGMMKDEEFFGFRVRPVKNPIDAGESSAHFYTSDSTSTFMVSRHKNTVSAMERGRNEIPNVKESSFFNKIRNLLVASMAVLGFSKPQWKNLVTGILKGKD